MTNEIWDGETYPVTDEQLSNLTTTQKARFVVDYLNDEVLEDEELRLLDLLDAFATYGFELTMSKTNDDYVNAIRAAV